MVFSVQTALRYWQWLSFVRKKHLILEALIWKHAWLEDAVWNQMYLYLCDVTGYKAFDWNMQMNV